MATTRSSRPSEAIRWFDLDAVGRAPARFDFAKLDSLNGALHPRGRRRAPRRPCRRAAGASPRPSASPTPTATACCRRCPSLKLRAKTLVELADNARFLRRAAADPTSTTKAARLLTPRGTPAARGELAPGSTGAEWQRGRARSAAARLRRRKGRQARRRRAAVARRADRVARLARHFRGHGSARPRRDLGPHRRRRRRSRLTRSRASRNLRTVCQAGRGSLFSHRSPGMARGRGNERCIDGREQS